MSDMSVSDMSALIVRRPLSDLLNDPAVRRKLAVLRHVEEVTDNVALTCRYFGISPPALLHVVAPLSR